MLDRFKVLTEELDHPEGVASGTRSDRMCEPNYPAFDGSGNLYITDSGGWQEDNGLVFRIGSDGETSVWSRLLPRYPNGCCLTPDGNYLFVVESCFPGISRVPIRPDGSAGDPQVADDPTGVTLNTPTNVAFVGPQLNLMAVANVGEWHLLIGDIGQTGAPLFYPEFCS